MNSQAYMMELICHAPPVPEWFKPIGKFPWDRRLTEDEQLEKRFFEWPSFYAKKVLEAAGITEV